MKRQPLSPHDAFGRERARLRLLGWRDYIQIVNTILFIVLGMVILIRVSVRDTAPLGLVVGGGFLLFGFYRLRAIWRFFRGRR